MNLKDLIESVLEDGLTKTQLEAFHTQLSSLYASYSLRMADLEKEEAIYIQSVSEGSIAARRAFHAATTSGLEQIEVKHNLRAIEKLLSSVKNRLYNHY